MFKNKKIRYEKLFSPLIPKEETLPRVGAPLGVGGE